MYDKNSTYESTLKYFKDDALATTTWMNKYALKEVELDGTEKYLELTPEDMHKRIAKELARIEMKYPNPMSEQSILELLDRFKFIVPQGGSMAGIGNDSSIQSLSNCFVIGNHGDSYGSIFQTDQELVQLMKRRGGVGTDLSYLRPQGTSVSNAAKSSSGAVSFMDRFSNSTREVSQNGRRGALMLSISVLHPDSEAFIDAKVDTTKVTGANISVKITDEFMKCVEEDRVFLQRYPIDTPESDLVDPKLAYDLDVLHKGKKEGTYFKFVNASDLWNKIIKNAHASAEPGVLFWDTLIRESPADIYSKYGFATESTNPCGELPLCYYDSCRLFAINLYSYVTYPFSEDAQFDMDKFKSHVKLAQRLMDDMIDLELEKIDQIIEKVKSDPEPKEVKKVELELWTKIRKKAQEGRRTGLGVTGEGDMLAALGLKYADPTSIKWSEKVHKTLAVYSYISSIELAKERGPFKYFSAALESKHPFIQRVLDIIEYEDPQAYSDYFNHGRRNIANLTLAPTGTTSLMTQTTSGIEPAFRVRYKRRRKTGDKSKAVFIDKTGDMFEEYSVYHKGFIDWYKSCNNPVDINDLTEEEFEYHYKISPYYQSTANDIDWVSKVKMQGAIQKWIDHSISCTVNVPKDTTVELINDIYVTAWACGCKGVTVYRDGSRDGVLIDTNSNSEVTKPKERPDEIEASVIRFRNGREDWVAFVGVIDNTPWEIFTGKVDDDVKYLPKSVTKGRIVKTKLEDSDHHRYDFLYEVGHGYVNAIPDIGNAFNPEYYNYARMISALLQEGVVIPKVINAFLNKLNCGDTINAWNKGVARALKKFIEDGSKSGQKCPHCGAELIYYNGCTTCPGCGQGGKCD